MGIKTQLTVGTNRLLARVSLGPQRVRIQHLIPEIKLVMESGVARIGTHRYAPNHFIIYMNEPDLAHHAPLLPALRVAVIEELSERVKVRGWRILAPQVSVDILSYAELPPGGFHIDARILEGTSPQALPIEAPRIPEPITERRPESEPADEPEARSDDEDHTRLATDAGRTLASLEEEHTELVTALFKVVRGEKPGELLCMSGRSATFGRDAVCDHVLGGDRQVSRQHFRVFVEDGRLGVEDLGSGNGTRLDGQRVERGWLAKESRIIAGDTELELVLSPMIAG